MFLDCNPPYTSQHGVLESSLWWHTSIPHIIVHSFVNYLDYPPMATFLLIMVHDPTPIAKNRHAFIFNRDPLWFRTSHIHKQPFTRQQGNIDIDPDLYTTSMTITFGRFLNVFNLAQSASNDLSIPPFHTYNLQPTNLYPKGCWIKPSILHYCSFTRMKQAIVFIKRPWSSHQHTLWVIFIIKLKHNYIVSKVAYIKTSPKPPHDH